MPRHKDPRLRLTRVDRGKHTMPMPADGQRMETSAGAFENECRCGMANCSWLRKRDRVTRGHRERVGSWQTHDGRFRLEWECSRGVASRSHPDGYLRMWDARRLVASWYVNMRSARAEMRKRYEQDGQWNGGVKP